MAARRLLLPVLLLAATTAAAALWPSFVVWLADRPMPMALMVGTRVLALLTWAAGAFMIVRALDVLLWHGLLVWRGRRPPPRLLIDGTAALIWVVTGFLVAGQVLELPVAGIITTSGVAVAILGFALRDVLTSLFAGIALNLERPFQIGDWIELEEGLPGVVVEIGWLTTRASTRDGMGIVIPNAQLAARPFRNYSAPGDLWRDTIAVPIDYEAAPERVERVLLAAAAELPETGPPLPPPDVQIQDFTSRGVLWQLRYWVPDYGAVPNTRYRVQRAVLRHLHQAGLALAYAKLDLFHAPMPERRLDPDEAVPGLLARCDLFGALSREELSELAAKSRTRRVAAGEELLRAGDPGRSLLIVIEGVLEVWHDPAEGARRWINALGAGAVVGEFALLTGEPRSATVTVKRDALLLEIDRDALAPVLAHRPALARALGEMLAERQARTDRLTRPRLPETMPVRDDPGRLAQLIRAVFHLDRSPAPNRQPRRTIGHG